MKAIYWQFISFSVSSLFYLRLLSLSRSIPHSLPDTREIKNINNKKKNNTNKSIMWRKKKVGLPFVIFFCRLSSAHQPRGAALLFGRLTQRLCSWHRAHISDGRAATVWKWCRVGAICVRNKWKKCTHPSAEGHYSPPRPSTPDNSGLSDTSWEVGRGLSWQPRQPPLLFGWLRPLLY